MVRKGFTVGPRPLTTGEMARYMHVHLRTVLAWIETGRLKAYRTPGRHCRIPTASFLEFCKKYKMPIPEELR